VERIVESVWPFCIYGCVLSQSHNLIPVILMQVMELVFTMLKSLDEMSPFLKEEITHFERHIGSRVSTSLWQHYSKTAGSVEILRGGKVEKYVFRYDPKWQPDVFQKVTSIQDLMSSILSTTRLDNPQKRLEELVDTTINMHFEVGASFPLCPTQTQHHLSDGVFYHTQSLNN